MNLFKISRQSISLLLLTGLAFASLAARIFATQELDYIFLIWNLFLAGLPYLFAKLSLPYSQEKKNKYSILLWLGLWLLFLPNSFYILTDFVHLRRSATHLVYFDMVVIASFAVTGLMYGFYSVFTMKSHLNRFVPTKFRAPALLAVYLLCGFGIYLGRVLRWNSWDILTQPKSLAYDIGHMVVHPLANLQSWGVTVAFGVFLFTLHHIFLLFGQGIPSKYE